MSTNSFDMPQGGISGNPTLPASKDETPPIPKRKPGRPPKSLEQRKAEWKESANAPPKKLKIFRPKELKVKVIMYANCHKVEYWDWDTKSVQTRAPFQREIHAQFPTIPESTISNWLRGDSQEKILNMKSRSKTMRKSKKIQACQSNFQPPSQATLQNADALEAAD